MVDDYDINALIVRNTEGKAISIWPVIQDRNRFCSAVLPTRAPYANPAVAPSDYIESAKAVSRYLHEKQMSMTLSLQRGGFPFKFRDAAADADLQTTIIADGAVTILEPAQVDGALANLEIEDLRGDIVILSRGEFLKIRSKLFFRQGGPTEHFLDDRFVFNLINLFEPLRQMFLIGIKSRGSTTFQTTAIAFDTVKSIYIYEICSLNQEQLRRDSRILINSFLTKCSLRRGRLNFCRVDPTMLGLNEGRISRTWTVECNQIAIE